MNIDKITLLAMEAILIEKDNMSKESAKKCATNEVGTKLYERLKKLFLYNVSGALPTASEIKDSKKEFKEGHAKVGGDDMFGISWEYAYEEGAKWAMRKMIERSKRNDFEISSS